MMKKTRKIDGDPFDTDGPSGSATSTNIVGCCFPSHIECLAVLPTVLLTEGVVLRSDGGKAVAVPNEVIGIDNVGRSFSVVAPFAAHLVCRLARIHERRCPINYQ